MATSESGTQYVRLEESSIDEVPWHRRRVVSVISAGVLAVALTCSIASDSQVDNDDAGAENLIVPRMQVSMGKGAQQYHRPFLGSQHSVPHFAPQVVHTGDQAGARSQCGPALGLKTTLPSWVGPTVAHAMLPKNCGCFAASAVALDPRGRDVLEQEQQQIAKTTDQKKEGWAKDAGIDPKEYFKNINTPADLAQAPPFSLKDIHASVPKHLWEKNAWKSMAYLGRDILQVVGLGFLATQAAAMMPGWAAALTVWPLYALIQGLTFWGLFVVGHDCGHQSFSGNRALNDFVGNIVHSFILVPYHQWRISHRKHHGNHGHVENDESWTPMTKKTYDGLNAQEVLGRFSCPVPLLAYPIYLAMGTPDKPGSHYDPNNARLFTNNEKKLVIESNAFNLGMVAILAAATAKFGLLSVATYYFAPWLVYIALLDAVTYLHHHGHHDEEHHMPWYRGEEWSYLRGGLTCLDRDYGILNNLHHDIGTHVIHHLFPQMPHYNLLEATKHLKKVLGPYYRQPETCPGPTIGGGYTNGGISLGLPTHLLGPMFRSFREDHFVSDKGNVLFYKTNPDAKDSPQAKPQPTAEVFT